MAGKRICLFILLTLWCAVVRAQNEKLIDSLAKALTQAAPDTGRVNILNALAYETRYNTELSLKYCEEARTLSQELGFAGGYARALGNTGNAYYNMSRPQEALKWQLASLEEWKKLGNKNAIASVYSQVGLAYAGMDNYTEALKYQLMALKQREELNDKEGLSMSYFNLASVYVQMQRFGDALKVAEKGMALNQEQGDISGVAGWHSNMGIITRHMNDHEASIRHHEEAIRMRKELGEKFELAGSYMNIANVYEDIGKLEQALQYHRLSLETYEKMNDITGKIGCWINIGRVLSLMKDHSNGIKYLHMGLDSARSYNMRDYVYITYEDLASAYSDAKDYKQAYKYHVLYSQTKDSLLNETNSQQVAEMQTLYETEKKEKENEILRQKNEIQQLESAKKDEALGKQQLVIYSVTVGLVLTALLSFFVYRGYKEKKNAHVLISAQKQEVERQKELVEEKNKSITDSINYAKKIQRAILPSDKMLQRLLPEHFILYLPKDIVSGDFYWAVSPQPGVCVIAVSDCTGHGVPGAFMSMIGISLLNEIVMEKKITRPDLVLGHLREGIIKALNSEEGETGRDGMDIVLCRYDMNKNVMEFAAANNPVWVFSAAGMNEFKGDKFPVGPHPGEPSPFTLHEIPLQKGMCIYTFSDGYADQFGGPQGKKFKYKQLQELIGEIKDRPMVEQQARLYRAFEKWRGRLEQIDDVLIMGIRV